MLRKITQFETFYTPLIILLIEIVPINRKKITVKVKKPFD